MKKLAKAIALFMLLIMGGKDVFAQWTITAEVRPRIEYRHGYKTLPPTSTPGYTFIDQRTRFTTDYKEDGLSLRFSLQDVRVWGSTRTLNTSDAFSSVHEAWFRAHLNDNWSLKLGRQEIIYDDHRIFGSVAWTQQARSHDAALIIYEKARSKFHLGLAYNQSAQGLFTTHYGLIGNYRSFQYIWYNTKLNDNTGLSLLFLNNGVQATLQDTLGNVTDFKDNFSQTTGLRYNYKKDKLSLDLSFYYQMGVMGNWANTEIAGLNAAFNFNYQASEKFNVGLGYEYLSGQSQTDTSAAYTSLNHAFTPFYGTNHKFNGYMDFFYVGNHINTVGLSDVVLRMGYKLEKISFGADVHYFMAAADVLDVNDLLNNGNISAMNPALGTEIDLTAAFKIREGVMCKLGYSHMLGTSTMEAIKGGDSGEMTNWAWAMIIVKPSYVINKIN